MSTHNTIRPALAQKRILHDLKELRGAPVPGIYAGPRCESNLFSWDVVLVPMNLEWPFFEVAAVPRFHFRVKFPQNYPQTPLEIDASTDIPHPNVYPSFICLDLLQEYVANSYDGGYKGGWSPSYTLKAILLNVQSFLFDLYIPQDYGGYTKNVITRSRFDSCCRDAWKFEERHAHIFERLGVPSTVELAPSPSVGRRHHQQHTLYSHLPAELQQAVAGTHAAAEDFVPATINHAATATATAAGAGAIIVPRDSLTTIDTLPDDLLAMILDHLSDQELSIASRSWSRFSAVIQERNIRTRRELACFYTKDSFVHTMLGVGLRLGSSTSSKSTKMVELEFDLLSHDAFFSHSVRRTVFGNDIDAWLPVLLNQRHTDKVMPYLRGFLNVMASHSHNHSRSSAHAIPLSTLSTYDAVVALGAEETFDPATVLQVVPRIMNNLVVALMGNGKGADTRMTLIHASENALLGYTSLHHMLLELAERYPSIQKDAEQQVRNFIANEGSRCKVVVPDLGMFVVLFSLLPTGAWKASVGAVLKESFDRSVFWLLSQRGAGLGELAFLEAASVCDYRLHTTFEATSTGRNLFMFQARFLALIAPKEGETRSDQLCRYRRSYGKPEPGMVEALRANCGQILDVATWAGYHQCLGVPVPSSAALCTRLKTAVVRSENKGYHSNRLPANALQRILQERCAAADTLTRLTRPLAMARLGLAPQDSKPQPPATRLAITQQTTVYVNFGRLYKAEDELLWCARQFSAQGIVHACANFKNGAGLVAFDNPSDAASFGLHLARAGYSASPLDLRGLRHGWFGLWSSSGSERQYKLHMPRSLPSMVTLQKYNSAAAVSKDTAASRQRRTHVQPAHAAQAHTQNPKQATGSSDPDPATHAAGAAVTSWRACRNPFELLATSG